MGHGGDQVSLRVAADAKLGWWGPDGFTRLAAVTADPGTLPDKATWYLATNLPRPGSHSLADLRAIAPGDVTAISYAPCVTRPTGTGWARSVSRGRRGR
jgi:hypothetical protein